jgi:hypothetical protein
MPKPLDTALVLAVGGVLSTVAFACGDKLMLTLGNVRFGQVNGSARPASILAYTPPNSPVAAVVRELEVQSAAKRAGITFYSLDDPAKLDEALKTQTYDLLLVDAREADGLERQVQTAASRALVLPVVYQSIKDQSSKAAAAEAEKKFHCVLTAPNSAGRYLSAIDRAMELKEKARSKRAQP